jgi:SAM-dependent methyltransferase
MPNHQTSPSDDAPTRDAPNHEALVGTQFGSRAALYLTSAVHAQGPDLDAMGTVARNLPDAAKARVLDLGCGGGHVTYAVAPHVGEVVAYDLSPEMLAVVAQAAAERGLANVTVREGRVERLPFADREFDAVMSRYAAHHWSDFDAGLREAARVLKPGGVAMFVDSVSSSVPLFDTFYQAIEVLRDVSHVRNYSRSEWDAAMTRAGFVPTTMRRHRLRLDFATWIARMRTPKLQADAIRALQAAMPAPVARHFALEADGSFTFDVGVFEAVKAEA